MPSEFCQLCRTATNMVVTVTPKGITGKDGKMKMITVKTYHCEFCRSFVRSMDAGNVVALVA